MTPPLQTVLVTGGSRGIGRALVEVLAKAGYDVAFTYNTGQREANDIERRSANVSLTSYKCDLSESESRREFLERFANAEHAPYGIIFNAAMAADSLVATMSRERTRQLYEINVISTFDLLKTLIRPMINSRAGRIVLIGSIAAAHGTRGNTLYASSKAALEGLVRSLVPEVARYNITVNCVRPGFIETDMLAKYQSVKSTLINRVPAGRFGTAVEVAALVRFLLSPDASYINGATLTIDGGASAVLGV